MSLPRDLLDQLLSGYLDDALSAEERARVEQLLQTDDDIVNELAQLRELRQSLKSLSQANSVSQLDPGFADRVLEAAVARAHAEGLEDDHPLVRLSEKPSKSAVSRNSPLRYAGILVGLAASIVFAVIALRPKATDNQATAVAVADLDQAPPISPTIVSELTADGSVLLVPEIVSVESKTEPQPEPSVPKATPAPTAIVKSADPVETSSDEVSKTPRAMIEIPTPSKIAAVLVVNVKLTAEGRDSNAVNSAMRMAGLRAASQKAVTDEIAGFVSKSSGSKDDSSLLFLQAPAKKLDQFYMHLLSDMDGVESVGLNIAMDAPIISVAEALRPDPRLVQHDNTALELLGGNGSVDQLAHELGTMNYAPLNRDLLQGMGMGGADDNGPDVPAQVLVLIR